MVSNGPQTDLAPEVVKSAQDSPHSIPPPDPTLRLIWQLAHLCNITTSSISTWLSLEALARETWTNGVLYGPHVAYQPAMRAQAMMLSDVCRNLEVSNTLQRCHT